MAMLSPSGLARLGSRLSAAFWALRQTSDPRQPNTSRIPYYQRTQAGVHVTPDTALQNSVVWACHRYLTQAIGQLPIRVMKNRVGGGASEQVVTHPTNWVLGTRPNPELSPFQFKETLTGWALLWGNGYAEIERDPVGRVAALWPIHPSRVTPMRDAVTDALFYRVYNGTRAFVDLQPMDMFHLRGFGDGPVGLHVIEYAAQSIGWAQATELFGASFFGEGLNPAGFIEGAGKLDPAGRARLKAELDGMFKGPRKSNRWVLLDGLMKWTTMSVEPNKAQFIETRQHQVEEICRWFGVPPHKVMHLLRSTNNNIEHQAIEVVGDTIAPWAIRFEEECNFKLFGQNRGALFVKFDLKGLLRGDFTSRSAGLKVMRDEGIINANEWRDLEDMGPLPAGKGGDKYIIAVNMTELDKLGEAPANAQRATDNADQGGLGGDPSTKNAAALYRIGMTAGEARARMDSHAA